ARLAPAPAPPQADSVEHLVLAGGVDGSQLQVAQLALIGRALTRGLIEQAGNTVQKLIGRGRRASQAHVGTESAREFQLLRVAHRPDKDARTLESGGVGPPPQELPTVQAR